MRPWALRAPFEELGAAGRERFRNGFRGNSEYSRGCRNILSFQQNVLAFEFTVRIAACRRISNLFDPVVAAENARLVRAQGIHNLLSAPDVESAFRVLWPAVRQQAVGIFGGEKAALRVRHISQDVIKRLARDVCEKLLVRQLPGLRKRDCQLCLIIEHLLEMRDVPKFVHRIPVKAAAEMVAHSSRGHFAQREESHCSGAVGFVAIRARRETQEKIEHRGPGKFGSAAKAAMFFVKAAGETLESVHERRLIPAKFRTFGASACFGERLHYARCLSFDALAILAPQARNLAENVGESGPAIAVVGRKIGSAIEWTSFWGEPNAHRPSASACRRLHERHVKPVHVRTLLTVHFDVDEVFVHQFRDLRIFEGLVRHHMAPVTRRIADGEKDRFVKIFRLGKGLFAPRPPIHWVVLVLEKIGRFFLCETVHQGEPNARPFLNQRELRKISGSPPARGKALVFR